jgi:hypothetical protein
MPKKAIIVKDGKSKTQINKERREADKAGLPDPHPEFKTPPPKWSESKQAWVNQNGTPVCGAKKANSDEICANAKGFGTEHPGYGRCKFHGGSHTNGNIAALKEKLKRERPIYGGPLNIGPHEAILMEVQHTAGHVAWLRNMIQQLGSDPQYDDDRQLPAGAVDLDPEDEDAPLWPEAGDQTKDRAIGYRRTLVGMDAKGFLAPSVWVQMYESERKHLVNVCKAAVSMGVAERQVRIAEEQGQMIASVVMNIYNDPDLGLTADQRNILPDIARKHFALVTKSEVDMPNPHRERGSVGMSPSQQRRREQASRELPAARS